MAILKDIENRVMYLNYQEDENMLVLITNSKALYVYCFERLEFLIENRVFEKLDSYIQISPEFQESVH